MNISITNSQLPPWKIKSIRPSFQIPNVSIIFHFLFIASIYFRGFEGLITMFYYLNLLPLPIFIFTFYIAYKKTNYWRPSFHFSFFLTWSFSVSFCSYLSHFLFVNALLAWLMLAGNKHSSSINEQWTTRKQCNQQIEDTQSSSIFTKIIIHFI